MKNKLLKNKLILQPKLKTEHIVNKNKNEYQQQINHKKYHISPVKYQSTLKEFMAIYPFDQSSYKKANYLYFKNTSELFIKNNHSNKIDNILDLHGYCVQSSKALMEMFFYQALQACLTQVQIITGSGPVLKNSVAYFLNQNRFKQYIKKINTHSAYFTIWLKYK